MTNTRKKLIEVSIPLEAINAASKKQKAPKGYPTGLHKYWAPRPIAACRAVLFSQLVDDPSSWPDRFPTEEMQDAERRRLHKIIEEMVPWEASNNEPTLHRARWEIARSIAWNIGEEPPAKDDPSAVLDYLQTKAPPVYDPFSGTGSIPLEAQRLGIRAFGSDLNPVAVLIGKALVEIPPKFSGQPPINPDARNIAQHGELRGWQGAQGLADDFRYYAEWMRGEAKRRVGHLYPSAALPNGSKSTAVAWLWARTVRSPDPSAKGAMVPLVSSFMLSTKESQKVWAQPVVDASSPDGYRFEVREGSLTKKEEEVLRKGTKSSDGNFVCLLTGAAIPEEWNRTEGKARRIGRRLLAVVADGGSRRRVFISPSVEQEAVDIASEPSWEPEGELFPKALGIRVPAYGMTRWADLYTRRQLAALTCLSDLVGEARELVASDASKAGLDGGDRLSDGGDSGSAYADAVATYLAFVVDRAADYGSTLSTWLTDDNAIRSTFGRQTLSMTWDFCEGNFFGSSSAGLETISNTISSVIEHQRGVGLSKIDQIDARTNGYVEEPCIVNTDPPYYDNIGFADLSDFFYVWLRKSLASVWPRLLRRVVTPKDEELVATPGRHGGKKQADRFFMDSMSQALLAIKRATSDAFPVAIYYAFKQAEAADDGITSSGWSSFLQGVVDAGFAVDGTWPLRTESAGRLRAKKSNALASAIVLVCRKRPEHATVATRAEFIRALKRELPGAIAAIRKAGVGPVDMQQSVIGPGMGVFTHYSRVLEDDDSSLPVKTALSLINRVWGEIENELDANFDPETQVALAWYFDYGFDARTSGDLITLANAKNISSDALFASGVFSNLKGKAVLTGREQLPVHWNPASDKTLTVWECVQHTARVLNAEYGGGQAAARLVAQMGPKADAARALAYRLFEIATQKGWNQEALVYNELAQEWPRLEDLAAKSPDEALLSQTRLL